MINHEITCEKTTLTPLSLVWKFRDSKPPLSNFPACCYQQSLSCYITCQDLCVQGVMLSLWCPCLPLSTVTVSLHYLPRRLHSRGNATALHCPLIAAINSHCLATLPAKTSAFKEQCHCSLTSCFQLSAVTFSIHYLPRCLRSIVTCDKTPNIVTWSEHLKICFRVIITL